MLGIDPNLPGCPETTISHPETWNSAPSVDMAHLQELTHTILRHKFFNGLKRKDVSEV